MRLSAQKNEPMFVACFPYVGGLTNIRDILIIPFYQEFENSRIILYILKFNPIKHLPIIGDSSSVKRRKAPSALILQFLKEKKNF